MILHRFSIKKLLLLTSAGIIAILGIILIATSYSVTRSIENYTTLSEVDHLAECALRLRKDEKDFTKLDTKNQQFFTSGQSRYVSQYDSILAVTKSSITKLKGDDVFASDELQGDLAAMERGLAGYNRSFKELVKLTLSVGFKDEGVVGGMRKAIHEVENELKNSSSYELMTDVLMLRRHEKDFMLRNDTSYVSKFNSQMQTMLAKIDSPTMISLLYSYKKFFDDYVALVVKIGLNENAGITASMNRSEATFERALDHARSQIQEKEHGSASRSLFMLFAIIITLSSVVVLILLLISTHILRSIKKLQGYILRLGKGELPDMIVVDGTDEIAEMELSLNQLVGALSNTRDFAVEVGNGNFEANIDVFDNSGEVGKSLLEMRKKLSQVAQERHRQVEENRIRLWINEGIALVNDIVNKGKDDIEELCYEFLTGLVSYSGLNQAGILMEEQDDDGSYLRMVATYAFDRRKYYQKRVEVGEGLAGMCFWEKQPIYITDVPAGYSPICSALGEASPRCVMAIPLVVDSSVVGVLEMASFRVFEKVEVELFERVAGILAARLLGLRTTLATSRLLDQTKIQAQEMASQEEELRQNLEELHATQEAFQQREEDMLLQMEEKEQRMDQVRQEAETERASYLDRLAVHKRTIDAFGTAFLLAEFDLRGNLEWANSKFLQVFAVDLDFVESFNMVFCEFITSKEEEVKRWEQLRREVGYVGPLELQVGNHSVILQASYQPVAGVAVKGTHVFFSAAILADSFEGSVRLNSGVGVSLKAVEN